jgi:sterol desaturase/sphingolipid hydroxylase (fatty acid hydroxylase superfamily)
MTSSFLCVRYIKILLPKQPEYHDLHHQDFVGNFGVLGILDWIHGTARIKSNSESASTDEKTS